MNKFRVWNNEEMLYTGDFLLTPDGLLVTKGYNTFPLNYPVTFFTGIKDMYGIEIYYGDVLRFVDKIEWYHHTINIFSPKDIKKQILNDDIKYPYEERIVSTPKDYEWLLSSEIQSYWSIMGNIYQNPEYLKLLEKVED